VNRRLFAACLLLTAALGAQELTIERILGTPGLTTAMPRGYAFDAKGTLYYILPKGMETHLVAVAPGGGKPATLATQETLKALLNQEVKAVTDFRVLTPGRFLLTLDSGAYLFRPPDALERVLDDGAREVTPSPDGRWIAYVRDWNLRLFDLEARTDTAVTAAGREDHFFGIADWVYGEELDLDSAIVWSPDSKALAFYEFDETAVSAVPLLDLGPPVPAVTWQRYPKAGGMNPTVSAWVFRPGSDAPRAVLRLTADEYLGRLAFPPDGTALYAQVLNRAQDGLALLRINPSTGDKTLVLEERSADWVDLFDGPVFLKTRPTFLWRSERSGFAHLYECSLDGRTVTPLTSGDWEVTDLLGTNPQETAVYYLSTEAGCRGRNLYRLDLKEGKRTLLTEGQYTHAVTLAPDASAYVDTASALLAPPRAELVQTGRKAGFVLAEGATPELKTLRMPLVEPLEIDGCDALLIKPADFNPAKRYPVLIYTYGGPGAQMTQNAWGRSTFLFHALLTQKGYIVFTLDNRGSAGKGQRWEAELLNRLGRKELEDQLRGVAWLRAQPWVDGERIGLWGWSYGGYMTLTALTHSTAFKAGVAVAPVTDWRYYDTIYTERYLKLPQNNEQGYRDSSPVHFAADLHGALFLAHGTADDNVHFQNTVTFIDELVKHGKEYRLHLYPGRDHSIRDEKARLHLFNAIYNFILENL
jgi:dipeptidyl-peptidase-4